MSGRLGGQPRPGPSRLDVHGNRDEAVGASCAICGRAGRGPRVELHLAYGVSVWLCPAHRGAGFLRRRGGAEFVERLAEAWTASGVLTIRRRRALDAHIRQMTVRPERDKPGSYSWPLLRREAERRFAAGEKPTHVITELRSNYGDGPAIVPSIRTMRRWFTQARWLGEPATERHQRAQPRPAVRLSGDSQALIRIILTGVAYPAPEPGPRAERGP